MLKYIPWFSVDSPCFCDSMHGEKARTFTDLAYDPLKSLWMMKRIKSGTNMVCSSMYHDFLLIVLASVIQCMVCTSFLYQFQAFLCWSSTNDSHAMRSCKLDRRDTNLRENRDASIDRTNTIIGPSTPTTEQGIAGTYRSQEIILNMSRKAFTIRLWKLGTIYH